MSEQSTQEQRPVAEDSIYALRTPEGMSAFLDPANHAQLAVEAGINPANQDEVDEQVASYRDNPRQREHYATRLVGQAYRDHAAYTERRQNVLTRLPNRLGFEEGLAHMAARCGPNDVVAVYIIDLDGFKKLNDTHGHPAGDAALIRVAEGLRSIVRTSGDDGEVPDIVTHGEAPELQADANAEMTMSHMAGDEYAVAVYLRDGALPVVIEPDSLRNAPWQMLTEDADHAPSVSVVDDSKDDERRGRWPLGLEFRVKKIGWRIGEAVEDSLKSDKGLHVVGLGGSVGGSVWFPAKGGNAKDTIDNAEQALRKAKANSHAATMNGLPPHKRARLRGAGALVMDAGFDPGRTISNLAGIEPVTREQLREAGRALFFLAGYRVDEEALIPLSPDEVQPK